MGFHRSNYTFHPLIAVAASMASLVGLVYLLNIIF